MGLLLVVLQVPHMLTQLSDGRVAHHTQEVPISTQGMGGHRQLVDRSHRQKLAAAKAARVPWDEVLDDSSEN